MLRGILIGLLLAAAAFGQAARFADQDKLLLPHGYREWPLAGAALGMSYNEADVSPAKPEFHHVYLDPASFAEYRKSGTFPDHAVLVMEVYSAGERVSINRQGRFADRLLRVEAAVKDLARFAEGWAYFDFGGPQPRAQAAAFPKDRCWSCHNRHGATDNVFTQFYGPLRAGR